MKKGYKDVKSKMIELIRPIGIDAKAEMHEGPHKFSVDIKDTFYRSEEEL